MQKAYLTQVLTLQHPLSEVSPVNQVSLPVTQKSTSSSPDDTDTDSTSSDDTLSITSQISTANNRTLRPRLPISYNETLLKCLHGRSQIKTLHNLSIPLPDSSNEETQVTDDHTQEDTDEHIQEDTNKDTSMNITSKQTIFKTL